MKKSTCCIVCYGTDDFKYLSRKEGNEKQVSTMVKICRGYEWWEPWSSGKGRRLEISRLWVWTGHGKQDWQLLHLFVLNCIVWKDGRNDQLKNILIPQVTGYSYPHINLKASPTNRFNLALDLFTSKFSNMTVFC